MNEVGVEFTGSSAGAVAATRQVQAGLASMRGEAGASTKAVSSLESGWSSAARTAKSLAVNVLALGAAFEGGRAISDAIRDAEGYDAALRSTSAAIKDTGGDVAAYTGKVAQLADAGAKFGYTNTEILGGFKQLVLITGNATDAVENMGLVEDIARAKGVDLAAAATAVGKAIDGKTTSLQRYGIVVAKGESIETALAQAQQRYGDQAAASTTITQRLDATVTDFEAKLGNALLPTINNVASAVEDWISKEKNQKTVTDDVTKATDDVVGAFKDARTIVEKVDAVTGGFTNTLKVLIGIKVATWAYAAGSALAKMGAEAAVAGGEAEAAAASAAAAASTLAGIAGGVLAVAGAGEAYGIYKGVTAPASASYGPASQYSQGTDGKFYRVVPAGGGRAATAGSRLNKVQVSAAEYYAATRQTKMTAARGAGAFAGATRSPVPTTAAPVPHMLPSSFAGGPGGAPGGGTGAGSSAAAKITSGSNLVPAAFRNQLSSLEDEAKNATGAKLIADLKAEIDNVNKSISAVTAKLAGSSGKQRAAVEAELTALSNKARDLNTAVTDAVAEKDVQATVSKATAKLKAEQAANAKLTDKASTDASSAISTNLSNAAKIITGDYTAIGDNLASQTNTQQALKVKLTADLAGADKTVTAKIKAQITKITSNLSSVSSAVTANLQSEADQLQQAVNAAAQAVSTNWGQVSSDIVSEFEQQTNDYVSNVLGPQYFQNGAQTPLESQLASMQQQDELSSLQQNIAQATTPQDQQAAQRALDEYNLSIEAAAQRAEADKEYAAAVQTYTDQRTVEEHKLSASLDVFGAGLADGTTNLGGLNDLLVQYGIPNMAGLSDVAGQLYQADFPNLSAAVQTLIPLLQQYAAIQAHINGVPAPATVTAGGAHVPAAGAVTPIVRTGQRIALAGGGTIRVPGRYIGRDSVPALLSPGETVIDRRMTASLEQLLAGGGGGVTVHATVLGGTERQVGAALERLVTPAAKRVVSYPAPRI